MQQDEEGEALMATIISLQQQLKQAKDALVVKSEGGVNERTSSKINGPVGSAHHHMGGVKLESSRSQE